MDSIELDFKHTKDAQLQKLEINSTVAMKSHEELSVVTTGAKVNAKSIAGRGIDVKSVAGPSRMGPIEEHDGSGVGHGSEWGDSVRMRGGPQFNLILETFKQDLVSCSVVVEMTIRDMKREVVKADEDYEKRIMAQIDRDQDNDSPEPYRPSAPQINLMLETFKQDLVSCSMVVEMTIRDVKRVVVQADADYEQRVLN
jgi:uncharacterized protein YeeX (DUF496 family)